MKKLLKWAGVIVGIYVAFVVIFETVYLGYMQPGFEEGGIPMLDIVTTDAAGSLNKRRLARLKSSEGHLYVSAHHWTRGWYHELVANPAVSVEIDGEATDYVAVDVEGEEFEKVAAEFPLPFVVRLLMGFPPTRDIVRLDPTALAVSAHNGSAAVEISEDSFRCIRELTPVRGFYVDNLRGNLEGTLAAANSPTGGVYPEGSVVQLVPGEAMIKRESGFSPPTKDWEFFELAVSPEGTAIGKRGFTEVVNQFGGNCFACHLQARAEWDMICEQDHGCDPIPLTPTMLRALQKTDPRCEQISLTPEETEALKLLSASAS